MAIPAHFAAETICFQQTVPAAKSEKPISSVRPSILRELVSAIHVDAPDESGGKRGQHIHIKHDGLGFIPLNAVMKEETA